MKKQLTLVALLALGGCDAPQPEVAAAEPPIPMPADERQLIAELQEADARWKEQEKTTQNGIRLDAIREERNKAICRAAIKHRVIHNWVARVKSVDADLFYAGHAEVKLVAEDLEFQQWPSIGGEVDKGQPLISWVKNMEPGQLVTFSGAINLDLEHDADRTDCNPMAMVNPFYVAFKSIRAMKENKP